MFDDVWETIQDRYYDPRFNGVDWQAKRSSFRPAAAKAGSTHEFYELMRQMMAELTTAIESAVMRLRAGKGEMRDFVDIVFDAFDRGGAGRLAAWIILSGEDNRLTPVGDVVRDLFDPRMARRQRVAGVTP